MNTYNLQPLAKFPLSTQLDRLHPENNSGCMWADFTRSEGKMTNPENGDIYIFATPEQEQEYKDQEAKREAEEQETKKHKYDHIKTPFIDINNSERWRAGIKEAQKQGFPVVEMCEDSYSHFLECVPPKLFIGNFFMCGEPYTHNSEGKGVYLACIKKGDKFYAQHGSVKDYKENKLFQNLI